MKSVTIEKAGLRKILTDNLKAHRAEYERAIEGYRVAAVDALASLIRELQCGNTEVSLYTQLPRPEDHSNEYERVIRMLDLEQSENVTLSMTEFAHYVDDDWDWSQGFKNLSGSYTS